MRFCKEDTFYLFEEAPGIKGKDPCNILAEWIAIDTLINLFSLEMKKKMLNKFREGKKGWDSPGTHPDGGILASLRKAVEKKDWISVANHAAILWNRQE